MAANQLVALNRFMQMHNSGLNLCMIKKMGIENWAKTNPKTHGTGITVTNFVHVYKIWKT